MKVTYNKKAKDPTYYIQESYRNKMVSLQPER